jgi:hypothetical protein
VDLISIRHANICVRRRGHSVNAWWAATPPIICVRRHAMPFRRVFPPLIAPRSVPPVPVNQPSLALMPARGHLPAAAIRVRRPLALDSAHLASDPDSPTILDDCWQERRVGGTEGRRAPHYDQAGILRSEGSRDHVSPPGLPLSPSAPSPLWFVAGRRRIGMIPENAFGVFLRHPATEGPPR